MPWLIFPLRFDPSGFTLTKEWKAKINRFWKTFFLAVKFEYLHFSVWIECLTSVSIRWRKQNWKYKFIFLFRFNNRNSCDLFFTQVLWLLKNCSLFSVMEKFYAWKKAQGITFCLMSWLKLSVHSENTFRNSIFFKCLAKKAWRFCENPHFSCLTSKYIYKRIKNIQT